MALRLVQAGSGARRHVLIVHYLGDHAFAGLRAAAPNACILVDTQAESRPGGTVSTARYTRLGSGGADGILPLAKAVALAVELGGGFTPHKTILAGFSAGGQGATTCLDHGDQPDAVVIADGWHCGSSVEAAMSAHLPIVPTEVPAALRSRWEYTRAARAGSRVLVASHTQIVPPTYTSTRRTLELLTGWRLATTEPIEHVDGHLYVASYGGADAEAHNEQSSPVFAQLVRRAIALLDADLGTAVTEPAPAPAAWLDWTLPLGERCVAWLRHEMVAGQNGGPVVEVPANSNTGPRIRDYLAPALRRVAGGPDVPLHLTVANWCVAIQCAAARACAKPGEVIPHSYRVSGIELEQDAQEKYADGSSWWVPIEAAQSGAWKVQVGALALLERDDPKVRGDEWQRHLVRVSKAGPGSRILTLGGNEGNTIHETERDLFDADPSGVRRRILGFVAYPDATGTRPRFG